MLRLLLGIALLQLVYGSISTCIVTTDGDPTDPSNTLQHALKTCGSGNREVALVLSGNFYEGLLAVPPHIKSLTIIGADRRNGKRIGAPCILGALVIEHPGDLDISFYHVILDGLGNQHAPFYYSTTSIAVREFKRFTMVGCVLHGYTGEPFTVESSYTIFYGNSILSPKDHDSHVYDAEFFGGEPHSFPGADFGIGAKPMAALPWSLHNLGRYAQPTDNSEENKRV
jgi:hypothetical protein